MFRIVGHVEKRLDQKAKVNLKVYEVATWEIAIRIHILLNISRSKGNQTIKFGELIEYNMKNIFLETLYTKCG